MTIERPIHILHGDNRETLRKLPRGLIQCVVTSPPYWSVRDYQTPPVNFGPMSFAPAAGLHHLEVPPWTGQLGLEPSPWHYIGHLLETFRVLRPRLREDGTLWVNLGDTWHQGKTPAAARGPQKARNGERLAYYDAPNRQHIPGLKPKDLLGIPWMFAHAMQADGWWLRSEVIWHKPNPVPGSQSDRPTLAHETLFLFSKSERYHYDCEAIKEQAVNGDGQREWRKRRSVWTIPIEQRAGHNATFPRDIPRVCILASTSSKGACSLCCAPFRRDPVDRRRWIQTCVCGAPPGIQPGDLETFETPTGIVTGDRDRLSDGRGSFLRESEGTGKRRMTRFEHRCYAEQLRAGHPFEPGTNGDRMKTSAAESSGPDAFEHYCRTDASGARPIPPDLLESWIKAGWLRRVEVPTWDPPPAQPCVVLDPFGGSGTTAEVALEENRHAIVCELAGHYIPLIERNTIVTPSLALDL